MRAVESPSQGAIRSWLLLAVAVTVSVAGPARAQSVVDPDLQARILERSDGALFIYKDGYKFPIQAAPVDDEFIDALPDGDVQVQQLDRFLAPAAQQTEQIPPPTLVAPSPGPYVAVANPEPGETLIAGGLDIQGKAFDPAATPDQGTGVDRVQVFLEDRDRGGMHLGDARLGLPNMAAAPGSQFAFAGWDVVVNIPSGFHTLFIYARSALTGRETSIQLPVRVGASM
jgi:hypothetical protein